MLLSIEQYRLSKRLRDLSREENNKKLEDYIKEQDYVIFVKNYEVVLYNQGIKEEKIRDGVGETALLQNELYKGIIRW